MFAPGLHIIAADHGAGNTVTALNILRAFETGGDVFGRPTGLDPGPALFVSLKSAAPRNFLQHSSSRAVSAGEFDSSTLEHWAEKIPDLRAAALDPAHLAIPSGSINASAEAADRFDPIRQTAEGLGIPVFLVHFLTKYSKGIARERIAGCAYWSAAMLSRTTIERLADAETQRRRLWHYPAGAPPFSWDFDIGTSGLWENGLDVNALDMFVAAIQPGAVVRFDELKKVGMDKEGLSRQQVDRRVKQYVKDGTLTNENRGLYFKPRLH